AVLGDEGHGVAQAAHSLGVLLEPNERGGCVGDNIGHDGERAGVSVGGVGFEEAEPLGLVPAVGEAAVVGAPGHASGSRVALRGGVEVAEDPGLHGGDNGVTPAGVGEDTHRRTPITAATTTAVTVSLASIWPGTAPQMGKPAIQRNRAVSRKLPTMF